MAQHQIEITLLCQWASYLAVPIWIIDPAGDLVFCNEPAEKVTGIHFDEEREAPVDTYADRFAVTDLDGSLLASHQLPIAIALAREEPAHRAMRIRGGDGQWRTIEVTAVPLAGKTGHQLGAMALFWEVDRPG